MNPLTNVKNITKLNETELAKGTIDKKSWHDMYKESAWIFIGGLAYGLTEGDILAVFSQYGEIVNINLVRDKKTGKTKGFCFLCYANQKSTVLAVDNFNGIKLLGRTMRVDHVANYKPPKDNENDDDLTKQLKSEGCAPKPIKSETSPVQSEKALKKQKIKKEKKKHKKKKRKAEKEGSPKKIKQEKKDPGYDKYENLHVNQGSSQTRKRKISESESTDSEESQNELSVNDTKKTNYSKRNSEQPSHEFRRYEFNKSYNNESKNRIYSKNRNSESELNDNFNIDRKYREDHAENKSRNQFHLNESLAKHQNSSSDESSFKNNTSLKSSRKKVTDTGYHSKYHYSLNSSKKDYTSETAQREKRQKQYNSSSEDDNFITNSSSHHSKYNSRHKEKYVKKNRADSDNSDRESKRSTKMSHKGKRSNSRENDKYYSKSSQKDYDRHHRKN